MFQNPAAPLAPMTPHAVISAFNYLRAVQAGDTEAAAEFVAAEPAMPALLVDVAERIVVPVTALCGIDPEPSDDSFALQAVGRVFVTTLHNWAQAGPDTAKGIAHAVIRFTKEILTQDHEDVADILRHMEAVGLGGFVHEFGTAVVHRLGRRLDRGGVDVHENGRHLIRSLFRVTV